MLLVVNDINWQAKHGSVEGQDVGVCCQQICRLNKEGDDNWDVNPGGAGALVVARFFIPPGTSSKKLCAFILITQARLNIAQFSIRQIPTDFFDGIIGITLD